VIVSFTDKRKNGVNFYLNVIRIIKPDILLSRWRLCKDGYRKSQSFRTSCKTEELVTIYGLGCLNLNIIQAKFHINGELIRYL